MNTLQIIRKEGYVIVQMNRGKVNAINYDMVQELRQVFSEIEKDEEIKGVILQDNHIFFQPVWI